MTIGALWRGLQPANAEGGDQSLPHEHRFAHSRQKKRPGNRFPGRRVKCTVTKDHSTRLHDASTIASILSSERAPLAKAWLAFTSPPL